MDGVKLAECIFMSKIKKIIISIFVSSLIILISASFIFAKDEDVASLQKKVSANKERIEQLQSKIEKLKKSISEKRRQAYTLTNQISLLDDQVERIETEIKLTEEKILSLEAEMKKTEEDIKKTEEEIGKSREKLASYIRSLYRLDNKDDLEILLTSDSLSEFFSQMAVNLKMQSQIKDYVDTLRVNKDKLSKKTKMLENQKVNLVRYTEKLEKDKVRLEEQKAARARILAETKNSEARFQSLMKQAQAEQVKVNAEIQSLEKVIRKKLEEKKLTGKIQYSGKWIWPVPFKAITTYFKDPDYPFRYLFEHSALDLRASFRTPVRAVADGYVARVRQPRPGKYAYVMIVHGNGISTVYGHVSKIMVKEDQFVRQGDVIALSGGMPGAPGSGRFSTGPHLHLEFRLNGIPVDPLRYLKVPKGVSPKHP